MDERPTSDRTVLIEFDTENEAHEFASWWAETGEVIYKAGGDVSEGDELAMIRRTVETAIVVNDTDTTADAVARMTYLAWPESAARTWFRNWQAAARKLTEHGIDVPSVITPRTPSPVDNGHEGDES